MSLISIAHPDFRAELLHAAKRRCLVYANQILLTAKPYPAELEKKLTLADGRELVVRPIRPDDEPMIKGMFYSFSEQTKYLRYHGTLKSMPHNRLQVFCNVDYDAEMALVVVHGEGGHAEIIGIGRYLTTPDTRTAEMAFAIRDDWQRQGLGTHLFQRLAEIAGRSGHPPVSRRRAARKQRHVEDLSPLGPEHRDGHRRRRGPRDHPTAGMNEFETDRPPHPLRRARPNGQTPPTSVPNQRHKVERLLMTPLLIVLIVLGAGFGGRDARDRHLQQTRRAAQPFQKRLRANRRAAQTSLRPDSESGRDREGLPQTRTRHARSRHCCAMPRRPPARAPPPTPATPPP